MITETSGAEHSKCYPMPHCRVLPPEKYNGMIPEPLAIYSKSSMTIAAKF